MNTNASAATTTLPLLVSYSDEARITSSFAAASASSSQSDAISLNQHMVSNTNNTTDNTTMQVEEQRMKKVEEKCEALIMQNMALTQRLELTEMQLEESKVLNMQLKQAIQVARTEEKDKSDIVKMRLDSLERRTYYMERYFLSGSPST